MKKTEEEADCDCTMGNTCDPCLDKQGKVIQAEIDPETCEYYQHPYSN